MIRVTTLLCKHSRHILITINDKHQEIMFE